MQLREIAFNTDEITRFSLLINIFNSCVWGDEKGKRICHPATAWNVSSLGVNLLYRTADSPENLEFPFGACCSQACGCLLCIHSWAVSWPNVCHTCIFVTSHSISLNWYLGIRLQAWPKTWTDECYFVPFLITIYFQYKKRGSVCVNAVITS